MTFSDRGPGYPGCQALSEHSHVHRLLEPLMRTVASGAAVIALAPA